MKLDKIPLSILGFFQATELLAYITLVSLFMNNAENLFGQKIDGIVGPIAFLLLFITSASISGIIVLARPGFLFWEKRYKESFKLLGWTIGFSILYFILAISFLIIK